MPKGLFKNKAAEHKAQAKNEKKKAKRLALKYALRPNTLQDFEFAINQQYKLYSAGRRSPNIIPAKIT